jgi:voltage-gated potassium channel Kch
VSSDRSTSTVLVLGEPGPLGEALVRRLADGGLEAETSWPESDSEAKQVLERQSWDAVVVLSRDDAHALRLTLLCAHVRPGAPLWATLFDRTIVHRLREAVPHVRILSPAETAAEALADVCIAAGARPRRRWRAGVRLVDDALRLLVRAGAGVLAAFALQVVISIIALHESVLNAIFFSARALATVQDSPHALQSPWWFKVLATLNTLVAVGLLAVFTAALVRILSRARLTTVLGGRSAPARDHVLVAGVGQVGYRLMELLRARGIPVLGLELNAGGPSVRLAHDGRLPIAVGSGEDRPMLVRVGTRRSAVVAAVTSDDLTNVAIGLATSDLSPSTPLVLRLGDGDVAAETESLLHLGEICDVHDAVAGAIADEILSPDS